MVWENAADAYDRVASSYEQRFVDELADKPMDRELLDGVARAGPRTIVDVGCGPGQVGAYLRRRGRVVVGIDVSEAMASLATRRLDSAIVADMRALPLADRSADVVIAFYSVIHLRREDLGSVFSEFARVLRPDGQVLVSAHEGEGENTIFEYLGEPVSLSASYFTLDELARAARAAGLVVLSATRRAPFPTELQTTRLYLAAGRSDTAT